MITEAEHRINSFLEESKVLSYCSALNNIPYCVSCFYTHLNKDESKYLIFKSNENAEHVRKARKSTTVAGTILADNSTIGQVKGIQFKGVIMQTEGIMLDAFKKAYYKRFPFARTMSGSIWAIELIGIKMTDNTLGFGKKLIWTKSIPA